MRFVAGDYNGKYQLFVQKSNNDAALNDIQTNIKDFKFHSDFSYFRIVATKTQTITFPSHGVVTHRFSTKKRTTTFAIPWMHTSSFLITMPSNTLNTDFVMVYDASGYPVTSSIPIQSNGDARRTLTFVPSAGSVLVQGLAYTHTNSIPATSRTFTVIVYRIADTVATNPGVLFSSQAGRVTFGQGKFDSNTPYLYRTNSGFGVVLTKDRTVDTARYYVSFSEPGWSGDRGGAWHLRYSVNFGSYKINFGGHPYLPNPTIYRVIA